MKTKPKTKRSAIKPSYSILIMKDASKQWRWGIFHRNKLEVACNGEGIKNRSRLLNGLQNLMLAIRRNDFEIVMPSHPAKQESVKALLSFNAQ